MPKICGKTKNFNISGYTFDVIVLWLKQKDPIIRPWIMPRRTLILVEFRNDCKVHMAVPTRPPPPPSIQVVPVYATAHTEGRFISLHHLPQESAFGSKFAKPNLVFRPVILTSCWARISWGHKLSVLWLIFRIAASVRHPRAKSLDHVHTTAVSVRRTRLSSWFVLSHISTSLKPLTPASSHFADSRFSPTYKTENVLRCYKGLSVGQ